MSRFSVPVAVVVLVTRISGGGRQVLLQRRQNTGFGDGMWDFACSGHVEEGEFPSSACVRECMEELGISAKEEDFSLFTLIYKKDGETTYVNPYFHLKAYAGEPRINEPSKCSELKWFFDGDLPADLLPDRKAAYNAFLKGVPYIEYKT